MLSSISITADNKIQSGFVLDLLLRIKRPYSTDLGPYIYIIYMYLYIVRK